MAYTTRAWGIASVWVCLLVAGLPTESWAPSPAEQGASEVVRGPLGIELDEFLRRAEAFGFAAAVLVAEDGEVVLRRGYGLADRGRRIPITPETVFDIGSITKQFTAAAILKLEERGQLKVEDPIARYFADVPADKVGITIHHLLTHSSGLRDGFGSDYEVMPRDSLARRALESQLLWLPGTRYRYSNAGYSLLGAIVEKVSGRPYERFLAEELFEPAGLVSTGYLLPNWSKDRLAHGYRDGEDFGTPLDHRWAEDGPYWNLRANGGLLSTVTDLYRWDRALTRGEVLSAESRAKMFSPHVPEDEEGTSHYGYGWAISTTSRDTRLIWHNGGNGYFFADFRRYVDEGRLLVFLTNEAANERVEETIVRVMAGEEPPELPAARVEIDPERLRAYTGTYVTPGGLEIAVEVRGDQLQIPASDARVSALFAGFPELSPTERRRLTGIGGLTARVVDGMAEGDFGPFREVFDGGARFDVEDEVGFWTRAFEAWTERYGEYVRSEVLGTGRGSSPMGPALVTYVLLTFEEGARLISFRQGPEGGYFLHVGGSTRLPDRYRFVPVSENDFVTYNFLLEGKARVRFESVDSGRPAARILNDGGEGIVARRQG